MLYIMHLRTAVIRFGFRWSGWFVKIITSFSLDVICTSTHLHIRTSFFVIGHYVIGHWAIRIPHVRDTPDKPVNRSQAYIQLFTDVALAEAGGA